MRPSRLGTGEGVSAAQWHTAQPSQAAQKSSTVAMGHHSIQTNPEPKQGGVRQSGVKTGEKMQTPKTGATKIKGSESPPVKQSRKLLAKIKTAVKKFFKEVKLQKKEPELTITRTCTPVTTGEVQQKANQGTPELRMWRASNPIGESSFFAKGNNLELKGNLELLQKAIDDIALEETNPGVSPFVHGVAVLTGNLCSVWEKVSDLGLEKHYEGKEVKKDAFKNLSPEERSKLSEAKKQLLEMKETARCYSDAISSQQAKGPSQATPIALEAHVDKMLNEINRLLGLPDSPLPKLSEKAAAQVRAEKQYGPTKRELKSAFDQVSQLGQEIRKLGIFDEEAMKGKSDIELVEKLGRMGTELTGTGKIDQVLELASKAFGTPVSNTTELKNITRVKTGAAISYEISQNEEKVKKAQDIMLEVLSRATLLGSDAAPQQKCREFFTLLSEMDVRLQTEGVLPKSGDAEKILHLQAYILANPLFAAKLNAFVDAGKEALKQVDDRTYNELTMINDGRGYGMNQRLSQMLHNFQEGQTV